MIGFLRAGFPLGEIDSWSFPKFNLRMGLLEEAKLQDALTMAVAYHEPERLTKALEATRNRESRKEEWEPPSAGRIQKNMQQL